MKPALGENLSTNWVRVARLNPFVPSAEWELTYLGNSKWSLVSHGLDFEAEIICKKGLIDAGPGTPVFELLDNAQEPEIGTVSVFQTFRSSSIELYSSSHD